VTNQPAFSAQLPHRPLPVPAVRSTPVPRSTVPPTPATNPIEIAYETSAASNIAINVTAGQTGAPAGFSIQWMTLADYVALGNQWPVTSEVPNAQAPSFCKANFSGIAPPSVAFRTTSTPAKALPSLSAMIVCMTVVPYPVLVPGFRYCAIRHTYFVPPHLMPPASLGLARRLRALPCHVSQEAHAPTRKATGETIQTRGR
jgi:hypothetical protein